MPPLDYIETLFLAALLTCLTPLMGIYIAKIFAGKTTWVHPLLGWLESSCYRISGVNPASEMTWTFYAKTLLLFNFWGFLSVFLIQHFQYLLPLNPEQFPSVPWDVALNVSVGAATNTGWQAYAGETTLSYLTQMAGVSAQTFLGAATGIAVSAAFIRGFVRKMTDTIGNFWSDIVRAVVYLLIPGATFLAVLLAGQGVIQSFSPYKEAFTLENINQIIPLGPVASEAAIKQLSADGSGFFNAGNTHPFANPTPLSNFLNLFAMFIIPVGLVYAYGILISSKRHGLLLLGVMSSLFVVGLAVALYGGYLYNPSITHSPMLEGTEIRIGVINSLTWAAGTTATSSGSVNAMLSSLSPLSGGAALFNIMLGGLVFGGAGVGLCHMLMYTLLTVFLCGLMVGRTPEYLGKKIEKSDIQWVLLAIFMPTALILIGAGFSCMTSTAVEKLKNLGPHGLSEVIFAFTSAAVNNGSSFAGVSVHTPFYNVVLAGVMLMGRFSIIIPVLGLAGNLAKKNIAPVSEGTFSTNSLLFAGLLITIILTVGVLNFFPALALGPLIEHFLMLQGRTF